MSRGNNTIVLMEYMDKEIGTLKLSNQAGVVCYLECYWKKGKNGKAERIGKTDSILLGQSGTLNIWETSIGDDDDIWVTAFANVAAGKDCSGSTWLRYKADSRDTAEFTISGVINFTTVSFDRVYVHQDGIFRGFAIPVDGLTFLDHTYVHIEKEDQSLIKYGCWGRADDGRQICEGTGDVADAEMIATPSGLAGIVYGVTGVCHQTANRILYPAQVTVMQAGGYAISSAIYGTYGLGEFNHNMVESCNDAYFDGLMNIRRKYQGMESDSNAHIDKTTEELALLAKNKLGEDREINVDALRTIVAYADSERAKIVSRRDLTEISMKVLINMLANRIAERFAEILSDNEYKDFVGVQKGQQLAIV